MQSLYNVVVDTCDLQCPQPMLATKKQLSGLTVGSIALIKAADPSFVLDLQVFVQQHNMCLVRSWQEQKIFYFEVRI